MRLGLVFCGVALFGCAAHAPGSAVGRAAQGERPPRSGLALGDWSSKRDKELARSPRGGSADRLAKDTHEAAATDSLEPDADAARTGKRHPTGTPEPTQALSRAGERCLAELTAKKVRFRSLGERPGIETPVRIDGPVGGVTYFAHGLQLIVDCRMGLTLLSIAPLLTRHGVTRVRFSGAYVYRLTRHGKLSLHANGLALDIHELTTTQGTKYEVEHDFARAVGCGKNIPFVNRVACDLRETALFRELITPDYDADHKDHLHLGIPRLATTPTTLAQGSAHAGVTPRASTPDTNPPVTPSRTAPDRAEPPPSASAQLGSLPEALPEAPWLGGPR